MHFEHYIYNRWDSFVFHPEMSVGMVLMLRVMSRWYVGGGGCRSLFLKGQGRVILLDLKHRLMDVGS